MTPARTQAMTIKVSPTTRARIKAIGDPAHLTADKVVATALDAWEDQRYWDAFSAADEQLSAADLAADDAETGLWDTTSADGLEDE